MARGARVTEAASAPSCNGSAVVDVWTPFLVLADSPNQAPLPAKGHTVAELDGVLEPRLENSLDDSAPEQPPMSEGQCEAHKAPPEVRSIPPLAD